MSLLAQQLDAGADAGEGFFLAEQGAELGGAAGGGGLAGDGHAQRPEDDGVLDLQLCREGDERLNPAQEEMAKVTNRGHMTGTLADAVKGADVFFGMSAPQVLTAEMVSTMAKDPMVFAMANPVPEIWPEDAKKGGAAVVGTGRSDYPNQINNVLAFPGIFRGALDVRASDINEDMKLAAAKAIASCVSDEELTAEYIMPMAFDKKVIRTVADAVAQAARDSGVARI